MQVLSLIHHSLCDMVGIITEKSINTLRRYFICFDLIDFKTSILYLHTRMSEVLAVKPVCMSSRHLYLHFGSTY